MLTSGIAKIRATAKVLALFLAITTALTARTVDGTTDAGTQISIRAEASYSDSTGTTYTTASETLTITVLAVASVVVTPDETASSATVAPHDQVTRQFRICNGGNTPNTFSISKFDLTSPATVNALYFDTDASATVSAGDPLVTINQTATPQLQPDKCIGVLAVIDTNDVAPHSVLTLVLTARSNSTSALNGHGEDSGTIINAVGLGARLTDPNDPDHGPSKLINGLAQTVVNRSGDFSYTIAFKNSGDTPARNVLIQDRPPASIEYSPGSIQLNDRTLSDAVDGDEASVQNGEIKVQLALVNPGDVYRLSFRCHVSGAAPGGTGLVNTANVVADNVSPIVSARAVAIIDPFGVVFAGRAGAEAPISGAHVEIATDQSGTLVVLPPDAGFTPNEKNQNPFVSDSQGHFSFTLPTHVDDPNATNTYFLKATANGYLDRQIQLSIRNSSPGLFTVTAHALDNQALAVAGGFDLVHQDVALNDLAALVMNVPMFEPTGFQIVKSVDHAQAVIGDIVSYRIEVHNPTSADVHDVIVSDHLPQSFHYADGSALLSAGSAPAQPIQPQATDSELQFRIPEIDHSATAHLLYRVRIGVNARTGDQANTAVAKGTFPSGETTVSATASAIVRVSAGVFSTQQVMVGRVFVDNNGNGQFDDGDRPMPGVRLYLSNGQSVITDSAGLYNFPSLGDGSQVISLDPVSLPPGYVLTDSGRESGKGWTRLLRTPVGGGALLRQNFALKKLKPSASDSTKTQLDQSTSPSPNPSSSPATGSAPSSSGDGSKTQSTQAKIPGTYEIAATETIEPVAVGDVRILSPAPNSVSMTPGAQIEVRTAIDWTAKLQVNGAEISDKNIGVRSLDHKNQVATFTFVGINLQPGPNAMRATAIGPQGAAGKSQDIVVMGRGPVKRLQIVSERNEIQSGGSDATTIRVKAFDQWNNPALDGQVGVESSLGQLTLLNDKPAETSAPQSTAVANSREQRTKTGGQLVVQLENGEAVLKLIGAGAPGDARIHVQTAEFEAEDHVRITSEMRRPILVGFAEMSFGNSIPEVALRDEQGHYRSRLSVFYSGRFFGNNMLTLSYDTQRPINRTAGRDRLFQLDPLDRVYPLFGDSSTRFEAAASNSKVYARIDHKRSFAMFGDYETDMDAPLAAYARKLTGVKLHVENSNGDFISVTGARPDTAFARDVFPAGTLGLIQLSNAEILPGSETVVLETRDRRNPEVILSRETLARSVDYNLDPSDGRLFLLRYISTFDQVLNLTQIVVTYEHRATNMSAAVYTARARKNFKSIGLKLGLSAALQRDANNPDFFIGGVDIEKSLPLRGALQLAWATSQGEVLGSGNINTPGGERHDGTAYQLTIAQPLPFFGSTLKARYLNTSEHFFNPFGGTVTPGARRGEVTVEMKPGKHFVLHFGVTDERNRTVNVNNSRLTLSAALDETIRERVKLHFGFDHRALNDNLNDKTTDSNLVTIGAEVKATDKLHFNIKREQNLSDSDPTYPTQTTLGATYQLTALTKLFFTQRLAAAPIVPIADFTGNGFAGAGSRRETAFGVETKFGKYTSMTGRYQLENAINGTDSFAVVGLQNRLPLTKQLSVELGFERGFHLLGPNQSFNSGTVGFGWQPNSDFRASARYEYRDRGGVGQLLAIGAAGKLAEGVTALSRFQFSHGSVAGKSNESMEGMAALAFRPVESDRTGLLFSYTHRATQQSGGSTIATRDRLDSLAADGYDQLTKRLELYGHFALQFSANGQPDLPFISSLSYLTQGRAQYLVTKRIDWAIESRFLYQPSSGTMRTTYATEGGFWLMPDLRLGGGYNFTAATEPGVIANGLPTHRGFYFTITSKLSNLFDLFGTSKTGLAGEESKSKLAPNANH